MRIVFIILGIVILGALAVWSFKEGLLPFSTREIAQVPTPTPIQNVAEESPEVAQQREEVQRRLENLRQRLFEEGVTATARVDTVFPRAGLIIRDQSNTRLFVHWTQPTQLQSGQEVAIQGKVVRVTESQREALRSEGNFTPELESFLNDQTIFIEAESVTVLGQ